MLRGHRIRYLFFQSKQHYQTLDITKNASVADVRKAYLKKAKEFHPDRNPSSEAAVFSHPLRNSSKTLGKRIKCSLIPTFGKPTIWVSPIPACLTPRWSIPSSPTWHPTISTTTTSGTASRDHNRATSETSTPTYTGKLKRCRKRTLGRP